MWALQGQGSFLRMPGLMTRSTNICRVNGQLNEFKKMYDF